MPQHDVNYRSQWDDDAKYSASDCGTTVGAMLNNYLFDNSVSPDEITSFIAHKDALTIPELRGGLAKYGMQTTAKSGLGFDDLKRLIDEGRPFIALVGYGAVKPEYKQDLKYTSGHFVLVIGYDDAGNVIYHDPDFRGARRGEGAFKAMPYPLFEAAWHATGDWSKHPGNAIIPVATHPLGNVEPIDNGDLSIIEDLLMALDLGKSIESMALAHVLGDLIRDHRVHGTTYPIYKEKDGSGIYLFAPRDGAGAIWIPSMVIFYLLGGVPGNWTEF